LVASPEHHAALAAERYELPKGILNARLPDVRRMKDHVRDSMDAGDRIDQGFDDVQRAEDDEVLGLESDLQAVDRLARVLHGKVGMGRPEGESCLAELGRPSALIVRD